MLRFRLFNIPIEIQPWFWLVLVLLGTNFGAGGSSAPLVAAFVAAGAISILIHELGHALTARAYGARPFIVLQAFGGYAAFPGTYFSRRRQFWVTAAGPGAQLLLALVAMLLIFFTPARTMEHHFLSNIIHVSVFWAILNLLPVHPLDGGQMLDAMLGPQNRRTTLKISIASAVLIAILLLTYTGSIMMPIFLGMYAYQNWQELKNRGY